MNREKKTSFKLAEETKETNKERDLSKITRLTKVKKEDQAGFKCDKCDYKSH